MKLKKQGNIVFALISSLSASELKQFKRFLEFEFVKASSYLKFEQYGKTQRLLHALKYKGVKEIGTTLGELAALEIGETNFFDTIDVIVPVPIHKIKRKKRGYNQSYFIAEGIRNITEKKVEKTAVIKEINTESQTKKGRFKRWQNVNSTFKIIDSEVLIGKHILLVDDVATTGATIEAIGIQLQQLRGVKLSLLTIAATF